MVGEDWEEKGRWRSESRIRNLCFHVFIFRFFCQVSVLPPNSGSFHSKQSGRILCCTLFSPLPGTPVQVQGHGGLLLKKWLLCPIQDMGGTASLVIMSHQHTRLAPGRRVDPLLFYRGKIRLGSCPRSTQLINHRARLKPRLF